MKICAIIAEYNPFHNGHKYLIEQAKTLTKADAVICIMSGNFVQRGEPACYNKWVRTKMALLNGIDLVIELPTLFATSSAEIFAKGAIDIVNSLGSIDYLCFGAETDDITILKEIANVVADESETYKELLKNELSKGLSFPNARSNCIYKLMNKKYSNEIIENIVSSPNNILAIEYLKALIKTNSTIIPFAVKRKGESYNSETLESDFSSATAIRTSIINSSFNQIKHTVPDSVFSIMNEEFNLGNLPLSINNFEKEIFYKIVSKDEFQLSKILDIEEGLEYAIKTAYNNSRTINELIDNVKSKRYTRSRIQRIMIHILLDIETHYIKEYSITSLYARILGFSKFGRKVLPVITKSSRIPIVTKLSTFMKETANESQKELMKLDIIATNIYNLERSITDRRIINEDYTSPIIKL
jgi:predicted nucleotidyltransferase